MRGYAAGRGFAPTRRIQPMHNCDLRSKSLRCTICDFRSKSLDAAERAKIGMNKQKKKLYFKFILMHFMIHRTPNKILWSGRG